MRGFSQIERYPRALTEAYVLPEERNFTEMLDLARSLAGNIKFFNQDNEPDGTWDQMFLRDEAFLLASVMSVRLERLQEQFSGLLNLLNTDVELRRGHKYLARLFAVTATIPQNLVHWNDYFEDYQVRDNVPQMRMDLEGAMFKLRANVQRLYELREVLKDKMPEGIELKWTEELGKYQVDTDSPNAGLPRDLQENPTWLNLSKYAIEELKDIFELSYGTALFLKENSQSYFKASLESGNHQAHSGLLIAFCDILSKANESINRFTENHRNFYFKDVLHIKRQGPRPDKAILSFGLGKTFNEVLVPEGALFSGGTDIDGNEIVYQATNQLVVNNAQIVDLKTLYLSKDALYSPDGMNEPMISGIYEADVIMAANESLDESWPTLGEEFSSKLHAENVEASKSEVGFEVASPDLLLYEGRRNVSLRFSITSYAQKLKPFYRDYLSDNPSIVDLLKRQVQLYEDKSYHDTGINQPIDIAEKAAQGVMEFIDAVTENAPFTEESKYFNTWFQALEAKYFNEKNDEPNVLYIMEELAHELGKTTDDVSLQDLLDNLDQEISVNRKASSWTDFEEHTDTFKSLKGTPEFFEAVLKDAFNIQLSTDEGWVSANGYRIEFERIPTDPTSGYDFTINLSFNEDFPAIVPVNPELHGEASKPGLPSVRFTLVQSASIYPYSLLKEGRLDTVKIKTRSENIRNIRAYNQLGELNTDGPFQPFGPIPDTGSHLRIASPELVSKSLTSLQLNLEWQGLPNSARGFAQYYKSYPGNIDNAYFKVDITGLRGGNWNPKEDAQKVYLFGTEGGNPNEVPVNTRLCPEHSININIEKIRGFNKGILGQIDPLLNTTRSGYLSMSYAGGPRVFGHKDHPTLLSQASLEYTRAVMEKAKITGVLKAEPKLKLPNEPYTPTLNRLTMSYSTESEIKFGVDKNDDKSVAHFSHIYPFQKSVVCGNNKRPCLVPVYHDEGNLFIGIKDLKTPQTLNIFFHLLESDFSTGLADFEEHYATWYYLTEDQWHPFGEAGILQDDTNGLLNSGIVTINIPAEMKKGNSILDSELYWLRVSIHSKAKNVGDAITIGLNVLEVEWKANEGSGGGHLVQSLPAESISKLKTNIPGIKSVSQPIESYGGRPAEDERQQVIRITERLAHKNRAVTPWDYEKLVLQNFPSVKKAKCFPAKSLKHPFGKTPGSVLIALIPKVEFIKTTDLSKPVVNNRIMMEIRQLLNSRSSEFAKIEVTNPRYEKVRVLCRVKFMEGLSGGYYIDKLNGDLSQHIAPWQYDHSYKAHFGGGILQSNILGFIQALEYIQYVTELSVVHLGENYEKQYHLFDTARGIDVSLDSEMASVDGLYPWSILVPAQKHKIDVINEEELRKPKPVGIERMTIGDDFVVNEAD